MSNKEKRRIVMGQHATSLAASVSNGEPPNAAHLEEAILNLKTQAHADRGLTEIIQSETDQLYRELCFEIRTQANIVSSRMGDIETHMNALAKSLTTIRLMLNIFGEEMGGADTSELFKMADALMTDVLEPLARERKNARP